MEPTPALVRGVRLTGSSTTHSGERCIHHVPGGGFYGKTRPDRCYASEADATRLPKMELMYSTKVGQPFHRDGWVYEEKIDGWRMLAYKDGAEKLPW